MATRSTPGETATLILLYLSKKNLSDKVTKYKIWKESNLKRSTVYKVVENLWKWGLLRREKAGKTPTGQEKHFYTLTLHGLISVMWHRKMLWGELDEIARKQAKLLPLIFGKWDQLTHPRVQEILAPILQIIFANLWERYVQPSLSPPWELEESDVSQAEEDLRLWIYEKFLSPENFEEQGEEWRREYIRAVRGDPHLSRFVYKICEIKKPSSELSVLNFEATMESIKKGDVEIFARMQKPKQWKRREERDSELKSLMLELEKEITEAHIQVTLHEFEGGRCGRTEQ